MGKFSQTCCNRKCIRPLAKDRDKTHIRVREGQQTCINEGAAYSMPGYYGVNLSGDASVMLGICDYPEYKLLIGKR